jgi:hypothetical protein
MNRALRFTEPSLTKLVRFQLKTVEARHSFVHAKRGAALLAARFEFAPPPPAPRNTPAPTGIEKGAA